MKKKIIQSLLVVGFCLCLVIPITISNVESNENVTTNKELNNDVEIVIEPQDTEVHKQEIKVVLTKSTEQNDSIKASITSTEKTVKTERTESDTVNSNESNDVKKESTTEKTKGSSEKTKVNDTKEKEESKESKETEGQSEKKETNEKISLGTFKLTAYCPCSKCCGKWATNGSVTYGSIGEPLTAGVSIAVDPNVIPYYSKVIINGHEYIAHDTGGAIDGNRIDIFFNSHKEALNFGVQYAEVFIYKN